ncbi:unnamed protein product [Caenorhabditis sp. 36 PRJEB53466]|nr:unnamed protein product [Caenorhabditis sp. 36 PRJEB53466]
MVFLVIRLVGEKEDRLFKNIIVDTQISHLELLKRIEGVTKIPIYYQQIRLNGEELPDCVQPLLSAKDFDEILVKHRFMLKWHNYLIRVNEFREHKDYRSKKEIALEAHNNAKELYDARFFSAFEKFDLEWLKHRTEYEVYLANTPDFIRQAAKSFFERKFSDMVDINFNKKVAGSRSGCICTVTFHGYRRVFFLKTNHNSSSILSTHRGPLNLIELYVYVLLDVLDLGAAIQFIPNAVASSKVVYLCSEEIAGFTTMAELEKEWESFERKIVKKRDQFAESIIQTSLLVQILGIGDFNLENIGFVDNSTTLFVVDFQIAFIDSSCGFEGIERPKNLLSLVAELRTNLGRFVELVKGMSYDKQLDIAKKFILESRITSKLDIAMAKLDESKETFCRSDLAFANGAEVLKDYITLVREKIVQVQNS